MHQAPFSVVSPDLRAEFEEAVHRTMSGQRDVAAMREACAHMDSLREEMRRKYGVQNIGVDVIRELRGPLPEP